MSCKTILVHVDDAIHSELTGMGGDGHSRLRAMLLGGATAAILASMTVPVLMSH